MIVFSRRRGERIVIDGNIFVTILGVRGYRVRVGVQAPRHITVDRLEVHEKKERQRKEKE